MTFLMIRGLQVSADSDPTLRFHDAKNTDTEIRIIRLYFFEIYDIRKRVGLGLFSPRFSRVVDIIKFTGNSRRCFPCRQIYSTDLDVIFRFHDSKKYPNMKYIKFGLFGCLFFRHMTAETAVWDIFLLDFLSYSIKKNVFPCEVMLSNTHDLFQHSVHDIWRTLKAVKYN